MPAMIISWTVVSKPQFDTLKLRAIETGNLARFIAVHNTILSTLRDLDQALEKGEPVYHTKRPGGVVRHWMHDFISVNYVVFPSERVGWILGYKPVPESWPGL
jgi:hypothetical protein